MSIVEVYTDFIFLEDTLEAADVIFVPGSLEEALPVQAAKLWKAGYAPLLLPSGRYAKFSKGFEKDATFETEWAYFCHILQREGVPKECILQEDKATFTYENALRSRQVTDKMGLQVKKAILCCQAYHARRASLYYQVCFPEAKIMVCPVVTKGISKENWHQSKDGIRLVLNEVKHCGSQFEEILTDLKDGWPRSAEEILEGL